MRKTVDVELIRKIRKLIKHNFYLLNMCKAIIKYVCFDCVEFLTNLILLHKKYDNIKIDLLLLEKFFINEFGFEAMNDCFI